MNDAKIEDIKPIKKMRLKTQKKSLATFFVWEYTQKNRAKAFWWKAEKLGGKGWKDNIT